MESKRSILLVLLVIVASFSGFLASPHKHSHGQNKERMQDGAFSPRDSGHFDGEEHHSEFDHEAILGSVKEAEEFDNLSPAESKKRLAVLVKKMDLNADGFVDRHELKAWILRSFKNLSEEEAEDRFDDIDENNDGKISWLEYIKDTYGMESEDETGKQHTLNDPHNGEEEKLVQDDKEMFDAADVNKDKQLSLEEFVKFHSPEEHPELLPVILKQTLRDRDSNNNGLIEFQEYVGDNAKNHDREWLVAEKDRFDHDFDKDGDGVLNHNEILSWVVPSNE